MLGVFPCAMVLRPWPVEGESVQLGIQRRTFKTKRPMEVAVLNCWVTETKATALLVEGLHHLGEVEQRSAQAVDFVDDDAVNAPGVNVVQEALQGGPVHIGSGEAAIVVGAGQAEPAFVALAGDIGFRRFALGIQGVERLVEALFGRFPRVDAQRIVLLACPSTACS